MPTQSQAKRRPTTQSADKPAKRTRVSRACDQCRIAREKCDGLQPICSTCSASKRNCAYTANPKKRGIQPGYIRTLELALAWLFQLNPENETSLNDKLAQDGVSSLFLSRDSKDSNKLHKRWRKARFCLDIDKLLSGGEPSRQDQPETLSPESDDEDSDIEEVFTAVTDQAKARPSQKVQKKLILASQHPARDNPAICIPTDSWRLFDMYFTYIQCWLPLCEKHDILKLSYTYPPHGLSLSANQADSGTHAELWSVLAVGSLYGQSSVGSTAQSKALSIESDQLYETARSLVPNELGSFDLGHIKALLNLAVYNMTQVLPEAAWLLVGCAARILEVMDQSKLINSPRRNHAFSGCFLLDSMLALQLGRRPYFRRHDLELLGEINEDGLEEWQPWNGQSGASLREQPKAPILALSTFNNLLDLVDILVDNERSFPTTTSDQNPAMRLESWRALLPSKLDYIHSDIFSTPFTPPAILLQMTYYCTALASMPSNVWIRRILELLEQCQKQIGLTKLPPTLHCLMTIISKHNAHLSSDEVTWTRLQTLQTGISAAWSARSRDRNQAYDTPAIQPRLLDTSIQVPTPDSLQFPFPAPLPIEHQVRTHNKRAVSSQIDSLVPNPAPTMISDLPFDPLLMAPSPAHSDPRHPEITSELESFFDELASLDSGTRMDNQPQFMQNLGFAPDANMADLFSEYIPLQSSAFLTQEDNVPVNFDQYNFYDLG
ncbi:hypothetical protein BKA66DRAFT_571181 [Pyrenochaeta sp. MPI-SDFR-AT-0127]|nr:hypothetical protein BKA66DRAFT_571181 [Pyrenochaeta sp. MPI-SDFR-AT-0127]